MGRPKTGQMLPARRPAARSVAHCSQTVQATGALPCYTSIRGLSGQYCALAVAMCQPAGPLTLPNCMTGQAPVWMSENAMPEVSVQVLKMLDGYHVGRVPMRRSTLSCAISKLGANDWKDGTDFVS